MTSEITKYSNDEYPTEFTNVKTNEVIPINKNLLRKPLKRYLEMKFWTRQQCAFLAAGVLPTSNKIPATVTGLNNEILLEDEKVFRLYNSDRILEEIIGDDMPDKISPAEFIIWLKARPVPELKALRWLYEVQEIKSEAITAIGTTEIKEQPKETTEERQDRRLKMCEADGLKMGEEALRRMPYGIGKVADVECVRRQTFTQDVKAALKRRFPS